LTTIRGSEDAIEAEALFVKWQPLVALLALPPGFLQREHKTLWEEFCVEGYKWIDISCTHAEVGGGYPLNMAFYSSV